MSLGEAPCQAQAQLHALLPAQHIACQTSCCLPLPADCKRWVLYKDTWNYSPSGILAEWHGWISYINDFPFEKCMPGRQASALTCAPARPLCYAAHVHQIRPQFSACEALVVHAGWCWASFFVLQQPCICALSQHIMSVCSVLRLGDGALSVLLHCIIWPLFACLLA